MQIWPWLAKAPKAAAFTASSRSASSSTTSGDLPPSSSSTGFRCSAHFLAMILPTREEPVKLTRRTAGCAISASTTAPASLGALVTTLTTPGGRPASRQHGADQPVRAGAHLRGLEHHRVAAGERHGDGAHAEDDRRVPRRDADHHADRLAVAHGEAARHVGGDDLARDLRGHGRGLAQHAGRQHAVEAGPHGGGAGLGRHHRARTRWPCRAEQVGGLVEQRAPRAPAPSRTRPGRRRRPHRRRGLASSTLAAAAREATSPVMRVEAVEGGAAGRLGIGVVDEQVDVEHGSSDALPEALVVDCSAAGSADALRRRASGAVRQPARAGDSGRHRRGRCAGVGRRDAAGRCRASPPR